MTLRTKARRYLKLKQELSQLEREIKKEAVPIFRAEGYLATPHFDRILQRVAA